MNINRKSNPVILEKHTLDAEELSVEEFLNGGRRPFEPSKPKKRQRENRDQLSDRRREWEEKWTGLGIRLLRTTMTKIEVYTAEMNKGRKRQVTVSEVVRTALEERFDP